MKLEKALIIEDEKPNADRLKRFLKKLRPNLEIVSVEESISSSVNWLQSNESPDLIFMDVRLADGISFDIFNKVEVKAPVVFVTAFDEYAVKAFKYNSVDYLMKPVEEDELEAALLRFESVEDPNTNINTAIEGLLNYVQTKEYRKRFLLPYRDGFKQILVEDILHFHTDLGNTKAILKDGTMEVVPQTLEELEKQLDPKIFFRVNRQLIAHINSVRLVNNYFNGKLKLELVKQPKMEVVVSRDKANAFKSWLEY